MANVAKLEAVLDYIITHPEEHDQATWGYQTACGTIRCFAGTAVFLSEDCTLQWSSASMPPEVYAARGAFVDNELRGVQYAAMASLDLDNYEANALFHDARNVGHLEAMVKNIANGDDVYAGVFEDEGDEG